MYIRVYIYIFLFCLFPILDITKLFETLLLLGMDSTPFMSKYGFTGIFSDLYKML